MSNYIEHPASGKTGTFAAKYDQHAERNGQSFTVLGAVDPKTYDAEECGTMFRIRFADGAEVEAWPEEVESAMSLQGNVSIYIDHGALADKAFAEYEFGEGVMVTDTSGWEYTTPGHERTRKVYVETEREDDGPAPRWTLNFTVRFDPTTGVLSEAFAMDEKGQVWGTMPSPRELPGNVSNYTEHADTSKTLGDLYAIWDRFADVPVSEDGAIEAPFLHFSVGVERETIWRWFESQNPRFVVGDVMNGIRHEDERQAQGNVPETTQPQAAPDLSGLGVYALTRELERRGLLVQLWSPDDFEFIGNEDEEAADLSGEVLDQIQQQAFEECRRSLEEITTQRGNEHLGDWWAMNKKPILERIKVKDDSPSPGM